MMGLDSFTCAIVRKARAHNRLASGCAWAGHCLFLGPYVALHLFAFGLGIHAQTAETYTFLNLNRALPDGNAAGVIDVRGVTSPITRISSVRVRFAVSGEFNGDLFASLRQVSAAGTNYCVLLNRPGRDVAHPFGYDDAGMDVVFDDAAVNGNIHSYRSVTSVPIGSALGGTWRPDGRTNDPGSVLTSQPPTSSLAAFAGAPASGEWTLFVADVDSGGTNMLLGWELELTGPPAPDQVAYVLMPLVITNDMTRPLVSRDPPTFGLGAEAPWGADVDPTNDVFVWEPSREQARSFNVISIWITNSGIPPTSPAKTFTVFVDDYAELALGGAVVRAGQAGSLPVTLNTSIGLTNVQGVVKVSPDRMTSLALVQWAPEVGATLVSQETADSWRLEFQAAPGHVFRTAQDLAQLTFLAVSNRSAFVPVVAGNVAALDTGGRVIPRTFGTPGRVVVVEREPLLQALPTTNSQPRLVLYGLSEHPYNLFASPVMPVLSGWLQVWQGTMPTNSLWMMVEGLTNRIAPSLFFRAEDRFGQ